MASKPPIDEILTMPAPLNQSQDDAHTENGNAGVDTPSSTATPSINPSEAARIKWKKLTGVVRHAVGDTEPPRPEHTPLSTTPTTRSISPSSKSHNTQKSQRKRKKPKSAKHHITRVMDQQYFLEMVDTKHRYGINLRMYHEVWLRTNTHENFFLWLDSGSGRALDLPSCPRARLEKERVRYLSPEERQKYLVEIDVEGRLCWAKNGVRINTTLDFRDSSEGIVPVGSSEPPPRSPSDSQHVLTDKSSIPDLQIPKPESIASSLETAESFKGIYANPSLRPPKRYPKGFMHLSPTYLLTKLIGSSLGPNTWLFVADTKYRLYVGLKSSGDFQHSSFLQGARVTAAGLIHIRDGRLVALSPLSGHYRPPASSFRAFIRFIRARGVDTRRLRPSKAYFALVGLEAYLDTKKGTRKVLCKMKHLKGKKKMQIPRPKPDL